MQQNVLNIHNSQPVTLQITTALSALLTYEKLVLHFICEFRKDEQYNKIQ